MAAYHAKKRLGQNFLKSEAVIRRIVETVSPDQHDTIIEIGPGRGALTLPLAASGAAIKAVEFDRDLIGYLTRLVRGFPNVEIINADFLTYRPDESLERFVLAGNLPFNITTPVVEWCAQYHGRIDRAVFMVQKELGERLAAHPGTRSWSALAVMTQLLFDVSHCFDVSARHFRPPPDVTSAVVELVPRFAAVGVSVDSLRQVVTASFRQRRKLLFNNLMPSLTTDTQGLSEVFEALSLAHTCRAEELSLEQFLNLTDHLTRRKLV
ncbi:MAG: ribosomal RNA small subunit methyltransferase A [candidate division Zixibacteria bacterium]|nr:ribosomal RNA small subunit methyltransferase A [candidate division Zixibacteria bacterium]